MRHIRKGTSWGGWPTGPLRAKIVKAEVDKHTKETTEVKQPQMRDSLPNTNGMQINKSMAPAHRLSLPFRSPKTNLPSQLLTILAQRKLVASVVEVAQYSEDEVNEVVQLKEVVEVVSNGPDNRDVVVVKVKIDSMTTEAVVEVEAEGLDGRIMTSHRGTVTAQSIFDRTGP